MLLREAGDRDLEPFDPEIERTCRRLRATARANATNQMANNRLGIQAPALDANVNFEVKHRTIQLFQHNQFGGAPSEDPHAHLRMFEKVCNTFKMRHVCDDAIRLRLFLFSLKGRQLLGRKAFPPERTAPAMLWWELFFRSRTAQLMAEFTHFSQWPLETLYEAWERYKHMLKKCPHDGLNEWMIIQTFFGGFHPQYKNDITAAAGGALMDKSYDEVVALIDNLAEHSYTTPRSDVGRVAKVQDSDELYEIKAQLEAVDPALLRPDEMIMILNLYLVNRFQDQDQETNEPVLQSTDPVH
ncbi:hypothetical protein OSB04_028758 [Centaurea solstitialis]|uniref:Retrotransposon gag domain-containing protein n=1 Tax=Centaurea solstitialis TaxID=347529 RepID=A0AA38W0Y0_9ASTR|nr:hypothetical protein OSB04_028758 [Centaurea solstitialis]